jgi:hypothetical protein
MARRKIKRKRGEGIAITGPATIHVSRRVMLVIDAPREARVARLARPTPATRPVRDRNRQTTRGPIPQIVEGSRSVGDAD